METIGKEKICGIEEAAKLMKISKPTIRKYIEEELLPHRKIGGRYIFRLTELEKLAEIDPASFMEERRKAAFLQRKGKNLKAEIEALTR